ncbi:Os03g0735150 [Oryza sativa Japonica Group]|uniref:Os03g0735150 protein n=1 Tax=Oryza sativa subsp. japonica TaxID=39947 RepID=A0A0P0W2K8_ORYSJ|nr:hypothetical protein EE612_020288 [Oryza sativa]BAS86254.1 Os03g0735150 [Oryza sativa Japonica Group]
MCVAFGPVTQLFCFYIKYIHLILGCCNDEGIVLGTKATRCNRPIIHSRYEPVIPLHLEVKYVNIPRTVNCSQPLSIRTEEHFCNRWFFGSSIHFSHRLKDI